MPIGVTSLRYVHHAFGQTCKARVCQARPSHDNFDNATEGEGWVRQGGWRVAADGTTHSFLITARQVHERWLDRSKRGEACVQSVSEHSSAERKVCVSRHGVASDNYKAPLFARIARLCEACEACDMRCGWIEHDTCFADYEVMIEIYRRVGRPGQGSAFTHLPAKGD